MALILLLNSTQQAMLKGLSRRIDKEPNPEETMLKGLSHITDKGPSSEKEGFRKPSA